MLRHGERAPQFRLPDADMEYFDFGALKGKQHAVVFFYPRDKTPLCTLEATDFSDHESDFAKLGCVVLGVSRDDCLSHAEFRDEQGLSIRLLSDEDGDVCQQFGVCQEREIDGRKKICVMRSTFVIDKNGIVQHAMYDITPKGHAAQVFKLVKQLHHLKSSPAITSRAIA
jgi:thioredoxin-dependent peroxiredoxin